MHITGGLISYLSSYSYKPVGTITVNPANSFVAIAAMCRYRLPAAR